MTPDTAPRISWIIVGPDPTTAAATDDTLSLAVGTSDDRCEWIDCPRTDNTSLKDAVTRTRGEFIGFVDRSGRLHLEALDFLANAIADDDVDVVYTNEDVTDGVRWRDPFLKPQWSPERLIAQNYLGRLAIFRRTIAVPAANSCTGAGAVFEHELALLATEQARRIVHIGRVLYHGAAAPTSAVPDTPDGSTAVNAILERRGLPLVVEPGHIRGRYQVRPRLSEHPLVSIVIPTRGASRRVGGRDIVLLENCIASVLERSSYTNIEIVVVADTATPPPTMALLHSLESRGVRVVEYARPFNFSEKINEGALHARGDYLLLLNDDIEITQSDWIETLLALAMIEGVGAVGPQLRFEDGRLQHVGVVVSSGGAGHPFYRYPHDTAGHHGTPHVVANYLAVTGACLMTRRDCFFGVGGLSPTFPVNYNDVDFCLKLHRAGFRVVYTPALTLPHYESSSRGMGTPRPEEVELLRERWSDVLKADPYHSSYFFPGGSFMTRVRADGRPVDEPIGSYRAALADRVRTLARRTGRAG